MEVLKHGETLNWNEYNETSSLHDEWHRSDGGLQKVSRLRLSPKPNAGDTSVVAGRESVFAEAPAENDPQTLNRINRPSLTRSRRFQRPSANGDGETISDWLVRPHGYHSVR